MGLLHSRFTAVNGHCRPACGGGHGIV